MKKKKKSDDDKKLGTWKSKGVKEEFLFPSSWGRNHLCERSNSWMADVRSVALFWSNEHLASALTPSSRPGPMGLNILLSRKVKNSSLEEYNTFIFDYLQLLINDLPVFSELACLGLIIRVSYLKQIICPGMSRVWSF